MSTDKIALDRFLLRTKLERYVLQLFVFHTRRDVVLSGEIPHFRDAPVCRTPLGELYIGSKLESQVADVGRLDH